MSDNEQVEQVEEVAEAVEETEEVADAEPAAEPEAAEEAAAVEEPAAEEEAVEEQEAEVEEEQVIEEQEPEPVQEDNFFQEPPQDDPNAPLRVWQREQQDLLNNLAKESEKKKEDTQAEAKAALEKFHKERDAARATKASQNRYVLH
eukprot:TRINITY_DN3385_c0_g1_i4.p1 TRINITY_DN3385_c0_g1~~TRINITY_DN3385_c0_g1_i4.p1  ORF type:complete len:147 (-),score=63.68 TRINITY_DN3385_c0_g1_i4:472-912(-)